MQQHSHESQSFRQSALHVMRQPCTELREISKKNVLVLMLWVALHHVANFARERRKVALNLRRRSVIVAAAQFGGTAVCVAVVVVVAAPVEVQRLSIGISDSGLNRRTRTSECYASSFRRKAKH
jgi:hypothetical protein